MFTLIKNAHIVSPDLEIACGSLLICDNKVAAVSADEILAPAGSPACALAAFEAGADAIYAGLSKFNARERGENFTPEVMAQIVDHAHKLDQALNLHAAPSFLAQNIDNIPSLLYNNYIINVIVCQ